MTDNIYDHIEFPQLKRWVNAHVKKQEWQKAAVLIDYLINRYEEERNGRKWTNQLVNILKMIPQSFNRDILLAKVFSINNQADKALNLLVMLFYNEYDNESSENQKIFINTFTDVAKKHDLALYNIISDLPPEDIYDRTDIFLKRFYFGGAARRIPYGKEVTNSLTTLVRPPKTGRTITPNDFYIKFLKMFSSATPIMRSRRINALGGGYFLSLGGYGCVIDPGHHFLNNFFDKSHTVDDIDAVIVTHFHDDHYADLPSLFSLFHKSYNKKANPRAGEKIVLYCDKVTHQRFNNLINASKRYLKAVELKPDNTRILIKESVSMHTIPTFHDVFGKRDTGVGLVFDIQERDCSLIITGDTAWTDKIRHAYESTKSQLRNNVVLVVHVSSICKNEIPLYSRNADLFHKNHLCMRGICQSIELLQPNIVLLSEVGEELDPVMGNLEELIKDVYKVKYCRWCRLGEEFTF